MISNVAVSSYAGTGADAVVVTVDGQGYLVEDMVSDVRIMLENRMSYVAENPGKASPSDGWLKWNIKEKGIELAMHDREVIATRLNPFAENAVLTFVNMRLLHKWANKANVVSSQGIVGGVSPVGEIFSRELFGRGTLEQNLLLRTTIAPSSNDLAIVESAFRREILSKGTQLGAEMRATMAFLDKIGKGVVVAPKDFKANAKDALARFLRSGTEQKQVANPNKDIPRPKLKARLVKIKAGINRGTSPDGLDYENRLEVDVEMDATEITFADWKGVFKWAEGNGYDFTNAGDAKGDDHPVAGISWYDCVKWCNARSEAEGLSPVYLVKGEVYRSGIQTPEINPCANGYRLPIVSEWQYAARGGRTGLRFPWGNSISHAEANYTGMRGSAWPYDKEDGPHPKYGRYCSAPVASFKPNDYGLFDMVGNVWEMAQDGGENYVSICGGGFGKIGGYFMRIERADIMPKGDGRSDVGFRTLKVVPVSGKSLAENKEDSRSADTAVKDDGSEIVVNGKLVAVLSDAIRESLQQPAFKMRNMAFGHATFPSWQKFDGGAAYSSGEYVCIWRKKPLLDIEADKSRWKVGLGSGYEARTKELADSGLRYIHALFVYKKGSFVGDVPLPSIVLTLEKSNHIRNLNICAFTPDGHRNFGNADFLVADNAFILNVLSAISIVIGDTPSRIGDVDAGIKAIRAAVSTALCSVSYKRSSSPQKRSRDFQDQASNNSLSHSRGRLLERTGVGQSGVLKSEEMNGMFEIRDGVLLGIKSKDVEDVVVPHGIKKVYIDALARNKVKRLTLSDGVEQIGRKSGGYYPGALIETVRIPASVQSISSTAFDGHWRHLRAIEVATNSPYYVERGCLIDSRTSSLVFAMPGKERIVVPDSVRTIGDWAFNANDTKEIVLSRNVTSIGQGAFDDCRGLERLSIPEATIEIGDKAFSQCGRLSLIDVSSENPRFAAGDGILWDRKTMTILRAFGDFTQITIPKHIKSIGAGSFSFHKSLVAIVVPDTVKRIEDSAFAYCTNLKDIRLPERLDYCDDHFIMGCKSLENVKIPVGLKHLYGNASLYNCSSIRELDLPEGMELIGGGGLGAIGRCDKLERIFIPSSVKLIASGGSFSNNPRLAAFDVHPDNKSFCSRDGVLFSKDMTRLVRCPDAKTGTYVIPASVKRIDSEAFFKCRNLVEVFIPTGVKEIGWGAFKDCPAKTNMVSVSCTANTN